MWFSNDLEDSDSHAQVCLIRVRAKLCRNGPDLRIPGLNSVMTWKNTKFTKLFLGGGGGVSGGLYYIFLQMSMFCLEICQNCIITFSYVFSEWTKVFNLSDFKEFCIVCSQRKIIRYYHCTVVAMFSRLTPSSVISWLLIYFCLCTALRGNKSFVLHIMCVLLLAVLF